MRTTTRGSIRRNMIRSIREIAAHPREQQEAMRSMKRRAIKNSSRKVTAITK